MKVAFGENAAKPSRLEMVGNREGERERREKERIEQLKRRRQRKERESKEQE